MFEYTEKRVDHAVHLGRSVYVVASEIVAVMPAEVIQDSTYNRFEAESTAKPVRSWVLTSGGELIPAFEPADDVIQRWATPNAER